MTDSIMNTYARYNLRFIKGEGAWLYDESGRRYLDGISGIGVNALGHAHPTVTKAIQEQAQLLLHTSNLYEIPLQETVANKLTAATGMSRCFFSNSGAEANEAAIKIARLHGAKQGIARPTVITFTGAFHGRTLATLTATGNDKVKQGFAPFVEGFIQVPFNDLQVTNELSDNPNVVAVLIETIQGEGGINKADPKFLQDLRELCTKNNWLMMLDEVQTGNGRTGKYFSYQHFDWLPDVVSTAKGLGNGLPIGACLARGQAADLMQPGHHGSTYGGNPLACAAANAVITELTEDGVIEHVEKLGKFMLNQFHHHLDNHPLVKDIDGLGLMLGIKLTEPCADLVTKAQEKGLLMNVTQGSVIRLLPPLIITQEEASIIIKTVVELIDTLKES